MIPRPDSSGVMVQDDSLVAVGKRQRTSVSNCDRLPYPPSSLVSRPWILVGSSGTGNSNAPGGASAAAPRAASPSVVPPAIAAVAARNERRLAGRPAVGNIPSLQSQSSISALRAARVRSSDSTMASTIACVRSSYSGHTGSLLIGYVLLLPLGVGVFVAQFAFSRTTP